MKSAGPSSLDPIVSSAKLERFIITCQGGNVLFMLADGKFIKFLSLRRTLMRFQ